MTKRFLLIAAALGLAVALTPVSVTVSASEATCRIPFSFTVNGKALPPGFYTLSTQGAGLIVRGLTSGAIVMSQAIDSKKDEGAKLVFEKLGDRYTLREVWMGGNVGRELPRSRADRERHAAAKGHVERVAIPLM